MSIINLTSPYCYFRLPNFWLLNLGDVLMTAVKASAITSINKLLDIEHMYKQVASSNLLPVVCLVGFISVFLIELCYHWATDFHSLLF